MTDMTDAKEAEVKKTKPKPAKKADSVYSVTELAGAARKRFNVPPEVASAAMKTAGKTEATFEEAQNIINSFMKREVR